MGSLEEQHAATKIMYMPVMAWGELLTLGLLGASLDYCQYACPKGLLSDQLVEYEYLPNDHSLLDGCTYNAPSNMVSFCQGIRETVRSSNLPPK